MAKIKKIKYVCGLHCTVIDIVYALVKFSVTVMTSIIFVVLMGGSMVLTQELAEAVTHQSVNGAPLLHTLVLLVGALMTAFLCSKLVSYASSTLTSVNDTL